MISMMALVPPEVCCERPVASRRGSGNLTKVGFELRFFAVGEFNAGAQVDDANGSGKSSG